MAAHAHFTSYLILVRNYIIWSATALTAFVQAPLTVTCCLPLHDSISHLPQRCCDRVFLVAQVSSIAAETRLRDSRATVMSMSVLGPGKFELDYTHTHTHTRV